MPTAVSTLSGTIILVTVVIFLAMALLLLAYAARRSWPHIRQQSDRLRESGGPKGADFDTLVAREIERLPIDQSNSKRTKDPEVTSPGQPQDNP